MRVANRLPVDAHWLSSFQCNRCARFGALCFQSLGRAVELVRIALRFA
jgi:hypothetical protein